MITRIQQQTTARGGSISPLARAPQVGPSLAEGFSDIGAALGRIAQNELRKRDADDQVSAAKVASDNTLALEQFQLDSIRDSEAGATGFTKRMQQHFDEFTHKQREQLGSEVAKQSYDKWALQYRTGYLRNAARLEREESRRKTISDIEGMGENYTTLYQGVDIERLASDLPSHIETLRSTIEASPLSAADKEKLFDQQKRKLTEIANQQAIRQAPDIYRETLGKDYQPGKKGTLDFILEREGGFVGQDGASGNPALFGINRGSFKAEYDRIKQIYDTQGEEAAQAEARKFYDKEIWQKNNLGELSPDVAMVVADGLVNHWSGFQRKLLNAARNDATPAELIEMRKQEYERLLKANPGKYGQSFDGWMNRLGHMRSAVRHDSATTGNPLFDLADPEMQMQLRERARIVDNQQKSEAQKLQNQIEANNYADLTIAVNELQVTAPQLDEYRRNGTITSSHWATLRKALASREKALEDDINGAAAIQNVLGNDRVLEPSNSAHKKAADTFFRQSLASWQESEDPNIESKALALVQDIGIVPEAYRGMVQAQLRSNEPEQMVNAANTIQQIKQINPRMVDDFKTGDIKAANHLLSLTNAGYDPQTAVMMAGEQLKTDPNKIKLRETEFKEHRKSEDAQKVIESNLNSIFVDDPDVPASMMMDFDIIAQQEYLRTGSIEAANDTALDLIQSTWGRTSLGVNKDGEDDERWMKLSPEQFFSAPVPSMSPSEQSEWMQEQLVEEVNAGPKLTPGTIEADRLEIVPSGLKDKQGLPTYFIWLHREEGGKTQMMGENGPVLWQPNYEISPEFKRRIRRERDKKKNTFDDAMKGSAFDPIYREVTGQNGAI